MTPQIIIVSTLLMIAAILFYQTYDPYWREYEHLTDFRIIKNETLQAVVSGLGSGSKSHLRALELLQHYPNSTHLLFKVYQITLQMKDFEECFDLLKKIEDLLPSNQLIKQKLLDIQEKIQFELSDSKKIETQLYQDPTLIKIPFKIRGYIKLEELIPVGESNFHEIDLFVQEIKEKLLLIMRREDFEIRMNQIKNMWAIKTGQIEDIYSISHKATKILIRRGIDFDVIYHDNEDKILKFMINGERILRAGEIKRIIEDNIKVFEKIENVIINKGEINLNMIKELHLLFTAVARYSKNYIKEIELIRRGKFKIMPNYLITDNDEVILFARPSKVEKLLNELISQIQKLKEKKANPLFIASYAHINFILIHPFDDGNGRVARALASIILMENGLLPFNVNSERRDKYGELINLVFTKHNYTSFVHFMMEEQRNLLDYLDFGDYDRYINNIHN